MSFLSRVELRQLGLSAYGDDVLISDRCSIHGAASVEIGSHVRIDDFTVITAGAAVVIGSYVHIGAHVFISAQNGCRIGDFAGISNGAAIFTSSDDFAGSFLTGPTVPDRFRHPIEGEVVLGRHAVVLPHSVVMPGVTIPDGTIVGANSFVSRSLKPWSIYFGNPARYRRARKKDLLELEKQLLGSDAGERR